MAEVRKDAWQSPRPTPCSGQGQLEHVAEGQVLSISKAGDSTASPYNLFQCLTSSHSLKKKTKNFFFPYV